MKSDFSTMNWPMVGTWLVVGKDKICLEYWCLDRWIYSEEKNPSSGLLIVPFIPIQSSYQE
jgi:hypothetical protein